MEKDKYGCLAGHIASALGAVKGWGYENTATAKSIKYVLDELMGMYEAQSGDKKQRISDEQIAQNKANGLYDQSGDVVECTHPLTRTTPKATICQLCGTSAPYPKPLPIATLTDGKPDKLEQQIIEDSNNDVFVVSENSDELKQKLEQAAREFNAKGKPDGVNVVDALRKAREGLMFAGCMRSRHSIHDRPDAHEEMLFYANQVEETVGKYLPIVNATLAALTKPTQGEK